MSEWRLTTLDQLGRIVTGKTPVSGAPQYFGGNIPFVTPSDFDGRRIITTTARYLTEEGVNSVGRSRIPAGAVMISCIGSDMGKAAIADRESVTNQQINSIIVDAGNDPLFVYYDLSVRKAEIRASAGGSAQPILNKSAFGQLGIRLPLVTEQRAIAGVLGALDDKIEHNRRTARTLERLARAIFRAWFVDFEPVKAKAEGATSFPSMPQEVFDALPTRFVDSDIGPVPEGWEVKALGSLCTVGRGSSPRPINNFMGGSVPWLKIADATASTGPFIYKTKEFVTESGATKSVAVAPGDLILSNSASCGIPIFVGLHGCIHDGWLHFRHLTRISKGFLFHFMQWKSEHLIHIADGSVQKNLNTKLIKDLQIVVPTTQTHKAFAEINDSVFWMIDALGRESRKLVEIRDYLLPKLLSGDVRVVAANG